MAVYGESYYGVGYYGTDDGIEYITWGFGVKWDEDFIDEVSRLIDLQISRGRDFLLDSGGAWQRFSPGELTATFDNTDGRFNYDGPLASTMRPGRAVRVAVTVQAPYTEVTTEYPIMRGIIDDIENFYRDGKKLTRISVKDGLEWLLKRPVTLALVTEEEALVTAATIADSAGFDPGPDDWTIEQLGVDSVTIPYAFGNDNALTLINQLIDAEAGQVFHSRSGALILVTNDYEETNETDLEEVQILRDIEIKSPWDVIRTSAAITANPMVEESAQVLWSLGVDDVATWEATTEGTYPTSPYLSVFSPTTEITVDAIFSIEGAATSPAIDWDLVQGYPGEAFGFWNETNIAAVFTTTDIGNGLRLSWTSLDSSFAGGNPAEWVVMWAEITANPVVAVDPIIATASDATAITTYGDKAFTLDCPWIQNQAYAQAYADYVVEQLKNHDFYPVIQIEARGDLQFSFELFVSKINLVIATLGIDDTYRVGKIEHQWLIENGYAVRTTLRLEPVLGVLE